MSSKNVTFHPKDVDLNTDEPGCAICQDSGIKPLFGEKCDHKIDEDHCEGEDEWKYIHPLHAEGELAKGREGEDGWVPQKVDTDWEVLKNSNTYTATKGRTRGKYGSQEENINPNRSVQSIEIGWVKMNKIINPPRELQERYIELYLE